MRRRAVALALAAAAFGVSGCGSREAIRGGGITVGPTLTVYSSLPAPARGSSRDIVDGEKLALAEIHGKLGRWAINYSSLDEAGADPRERAKAAGEAARTAMADTQTAAVIGTLDSEGARASIPLLNAAGFLQVSLGAGYSGFTRRVAAGEPERFFPAGGHTFARVVGDDRAQARALVRAAGTRRIVVEADGGEDAAALASEVRRAATAEGAKVVSKPGRDGAVIYAGEDPVAAASIAESVISETPGARVVLPDEVVRAGVEVRLSGRSARRTVLVSRAPEPGSTAPLREFEAAFERTFARRPGPYAALGYAAMQTVLASLAQAADEKRAGERRRVIQLFFSGRPRETVVGPLTELRSGEVSPARFSAFRLAGSSGRRDYLFR
ncbi:MAG: branched-chain amino acid transport system substrate-binding protein [Solirubrobacteraceae bacterium]|nr:branched-chain amino acid transport system substrate-binding protein [Solirubrobacteraceae bacterium]